MSVTRSLWQLMKMMEEVADMRVDVVEIRRYSQVTEVRRIQRAFRQLVDRLQEYKAFMPAGLFNRGPEDDTGASGSPQEERRSVQRQLSQDSSRKGSRLQQVISGRMSFRQSPHLSPPDTPPSSQPVDNSPLHTRIVKKTIAVLVVNVVGFKATLYRNMEAHLEVTMNTYVALTHQVVTKARGHVDSVVGDQILVTFNAHIHCSDPPAAAAGAALDLQAAFATQPCQPHLQIQMGVTAGQAFTGSSGYSPFKTMVTLGTPVKVAALFAHLGGFPESIALADPGMEERAKYTFTLRPVDLVYMPLLGGFAPMYSRNVRVHTIEGRREMQDDEWLYQVGDQAAANPDSWGATFDKMAAAEAVDVAQQHLQQYLGRCPDDKFALRLKARMSDWRPRCGVPLCEGPEPAERSMPLLHCSSVQSLTTAQR